MKRKSFKLFLVGAIALLALPMMQSCDDDDDDEWYHRPQKVQLGIVTAKTFESTNHLYLTIDDSTDLFPINVSEHPYGGKEVRAMVRFRYPYENELNDTTSMYGGMENIVLLSMDSIRTKAMAPNKGSENETVYGNDPLIIYNDWSTVCEDGYLTLHITTSYDGMHTHVLNLVKVDGENTLQLYHNGNGDKSWQYAEGWIAFRLTGLEDTQGAYKEFTLKYNTPEGSREMKFKYKTRE